MDSSVTIILGFKDICYQDETKKQSCTNCRAVHKAREVYPICCVLCFPFVFRSYMNFSATES